MITFVLRFRSVLALALLIALGNQATALPISAVTQSATATAGTTLQKPPLEQLDAQLIRPDVRSRATFSLATALESRAIPESAKRQVRAQLAARTNAAKTAAATPPAGQSCADSTYNNILIVYGGVSCSVSEPSGATFGSCTWSNMSDPAMNAEITPMTAPAGSNSTLTFTSPSNPTLISASYTVQLSCGISAVTYNITVLPNPEIPGPAAGSPGGGGGPPPCGPCGPTFVGKPIDVTDGELWRSDTDVEFSGPFGLSFTRTYASGTIGTTDLGAHWQHNYDARLDLSQVSNGSIGFYDEAGFPHYFNAVTAGTSTYDPINSLTLALNSAGTAYTVTTFGSLVRTFNSLGLLVSLRDRVGNTQTITRDTTSGHNNRILSVADPLGRQLCFFSDSQNRVTAVSYLASGTCPTAVPTTGTVVKMTYDSGTSCTTGDLCSTTEPDGKSWTYKYATASMNYPTDLTEVDDPLGDPEEINSYSGFQVVQQVTGKCSTVPCADTGGDLSFTYPMDLSGNVTIVDGENRSTAMAFDPNNWLLTSISGPVCNCGGDQTRKYSYDSNDRILTETDDGVDGSTAHTITSSYARDSANIAYPGPTKIVENLDTSGTTRTTSYQYYAIGDARQDLPQITTLPSVDKPGSTMTINDTYSTTGLLTQRTKIGYVNGTSTSYTWKWTYDSRGRMLTAMGPRTDVTQLTQFAYFSDSDSDHQRAGQLETITDALKHAATYSAESGYTSYDVFGNPQSMTDSNSIITEYTYDARGRMLNSVLLGVTGDMTNLTTTRAYDAAGRLTKVTWPAGNAMAYSYDSSDRIVDETRLDSGSLQHERLVNAYNYSDQATSLQAEGCATPATSCASWSTPFSRTYSYSSTTSDLASIINADKTAQLFGYEDAGQLSSFNDENHSTGSNYTYSFDVAGRRLSATRKLGSGHVNSSYTYDLHDNPISVTDENTNTTSYHYDDFDRITKETSPIQGITTYTYDPDDDLVSMTDANSSTTSYTYDALDRELTEKAVKGSQTLNSSWTYDTAASGYFNVGRMVAMSDPSGTSSYGYDRRGNMTLDVHKDASANAFGESSTYDSNGNRSTITYPDGKILKYAYDFADRPISVQQSGTGSAPQATARLAIDSLMSREPQHFAPESARNAERQRNILTIERRQAPARGSGLLNRGIDATQKNMDPERLRGKSVTKFIEKPAASSATVFVSAATYEPFGPIETITYGNTSVQTFSYDDRYRVTENKLVASKTLDDHKYSLDAFGNITALTDNLNAAYDRSFAYDDLNRITTASSGTSLWGNASGNGYTYDAMGNLKTLQLGSTRTDTFSYLAGTGSSIGLPKLKSVLENSTTRNVTYDAFGNELTDGKSTFTYSSRELLASDSADVSTYYYDGFRRRTATTLSSGGTRETIFDTPTNHMLAETTTTTGTPTIQYDYVWFGSQPVAQLASSGTSWTYSDHLGTPLIQSDINDNVTWQAEYEPFGDIWALRAGNVHQPIRLPGQVSEQFDTGANGSSELSYNNARWYRSTWGQYAEHDPLGLGTSLNEYSYGASNPISNSDASGLLTKSQQQDLGNYLKSHGPGASTPFTPAGTECTNYIEQVYQNSLGIPLGDEVSNAIGGFKLGGGVDSNGFSHSRNPLICWKDKYNSDNLANFFKRRGELKSFSQVKCFEVGDIIFTSDPFEPGYDHALMVMSTSNGSISQIAESTGNFVVYRPIGQLMALMSQERKTPQSVARYGPNSECQCR